MTARRSKIYLAGPEVFLPNAMEIGRRKAAACAAAGFEGCFPLDNALDLAGLAKPEQARRIALANEAMMRSCDLIIANCTPFRGVSMDSGTAFEIGFMRALGRPVFGYTTARGDYASRAKTFRTAPRHHFDCDRPTTDIEDFDQVENLMITVAIEQSGSRVVIHAPASGDAVMDDLTAFALCLDETCASTKSGALF